MMTQKVNRNILWCEIFVEQLVRSGVKYACISPGSRSAPLTYSLAQQKNIKCFVNIDERSSAFFALGLAKGTGSLVVVVTTSGTAVAELYPAIIESYQQRIPLLICTADRPTDLKNTGANQMINQKNIYRNHIRWFKDVGLPELSEKKLNRLLFITNKAFDISTNSDKGPVHLNFPFRKPLEPDSFTDDVDEGFLNTTKKYLSTKTLKSISDLRKKERKSINNILEKILTSQKGLIVAGPQEYNSKLKSAIGSLAARIGYPVLADGVSQLRFFPENNSLISNYDAFMRSKIFRNKFRPDIVLQFGRTVTSSSLEKYFEEIDSDRFLISESGDYFDPLIKAKLVKINPESFCIELIKSLNELKFNKINNDWISGFQTSETLTEKIKSKIILNSSFPNECRIIPEIVKIMPSKSSLMIGNSLPIRDMDYFVSRTDKYLKIFFNRGASGIDGVTSTAMGISKNNKPTLLVTGDLSFLHDINSLLAAKQNRVALVIVVINNNGGGIFDSLPISQQKIFFQHYFKTPHNQNIKNLVESFGHSYIRINGWIHFKECILTCIKKNSVTVLEIKTNSTASHKLREKYWSEVTEKINSLIN